MSRRVPKRRFKGFEGEWEQHKLGDIAEIKDSARIPNDEWTDDGVPYIRASDISNGDISGVLFISNERYEYYKEITGAPIYGDVLFNGGGEMGKSFLITDNTPIYVQGGAVLYAKTSESNSLVGRFLSVFFETEIANKYIDIVAAGGTIKHFTLKPSKEMPISLPIREEQKKIGDLFKNIDNLITLHQQKYDKLQALKKAYLYEMFPQEGESVPKRRFAGFSGEWEKSYIENIASFSKGIGYTKNDLQPEGTPIILYGRLYTDYEFEIKNVNSFADKNDFAMISKGNEVIVPASGETAEDIARASAVNVAGCILGGDLNIITPNSEIDSAFLALAMSNGYSSKDLARRAQGKTVVHVHNSDIKEVMVSYPSINEQQKIVNYVRNLDNNIKVINAKLQKLKALKQSYLAEMFV